MKKRILSIVMGLTMCVVLFSACSPNQGGNTGTETVTDYVSCVSSDNYGNGVITAELFAEAIGGEGEAGMCYGNVNLYPVEQRKIGFLETMESKYPGIEIVESTPCETAADCEDAMNAMLLKHSNLKGAFGWYDEPCIVIAASARALGILGCYGEDPTEMIMNEARK